jgi:hypothetical protein
LPYQKIYISVATFRTTDDLTDLASETNETANTKANAFHHACLPESLA